MFLDTCEAEIMNFEIRIRRSGTVAHVSQPHELETQFPSCVIGRGKFHRRKVTQFCGSSNRKTNMIGESRSGSNTARVRCILSFPDRRGKACQ